MLFFIYRCQCKNGGFGGGPGQLAHLAPTYAAVNALITIGSPAAYAVINRLVYFSLPYQWHNFSVKIYYNDPL